MIVAKYVLSILMVAFTSFCGYLLAKKYRKKKEFYIQFSLFNERFITELSYFRRPILQFIHSYAYKGEFLFFLNAYLELNDKSNAHLQSITEHAAFYFLTFDEKAMLINYFSMLGKGDSHSQKSYFSSIKDFLNKAENQAIENCKKYETLYLKLGFLFGVLIIILII